MLVYSRTHTTWPESAVRLRLGIGQLHVKTRETWPKSELRRGVWHDYM